MYKSSILIILLTSTCLPRSTLYLEINVCGGFRCGAVAHRRKRGESSTRTYVDSSPKRHWYCKVFYLHLIQFNSSYTSDQVCVQITVSISISQAVITRDCSINICYLQHTVLYVRGKINHQRRDSFYRAVHTHVGIGEIFGDMK